jgi:hypothetical protein
VSHDLTTGQACFIGSIGKAMVKKASVPLLLEFNIATVIVIE